MNTTYYSTRSTKARQRREAIELIAGLLFIGLFTVAIMVIF